MYDMEKNPIASSKDSDKRQRAVAATFLTDVEL
jgi:hypothetical protein